MNEMNIPISISKEESLELCATYAYKMSFKFELHGLLDIAVKAKECKGKGWRDPLMLHVSP